MHLNHRELLDRMLLVAEKTIDQIQDASLVGSVLHGTYTDRSDIDTYLWVKDSDKATLRARYKGRILSVKVRPFGDFDLPFAGKYVLPKLSLITGIMTDEHNNDLEKYRKDRGK